MSQVSTPSIDQLRELPLPAIDVSYWPQTWGWLVLLVAVLALAGGLATWRYLRWRRNLYRREALARLEVLAQALNDPVQRLAALREVPQLLKRVALSMPGQGPVATLGGDDWQAFLQRHSRVQLPGQLARRLALLAYAPADQIVAMTDSDIQALIATCRQWIEVHHVAT